MNQLISTLIRIAKIYFNVKFNLKIGGQTLDFTFKIKSSPVYGELFKMKYYSSTVVSAGGSTKVIIGQIPCFLALR